MILELTRGVPMALVVQFLQERGLACVIEGETLRVRWSPRSVPVEGSEPFLTSFLRYAVGDD